MSSDVKRGAAMKLYAIGDWVMRANTDRLRPRSVHLVESLIAGDVITHCGRRMSDEPTKTGGRLWAVGPVEVGTCRQCLRSDPPEL